MFKGATSDGIVGAMKSLVSSAKMGYIQLIKGWDTKELCAATLLFEGSHTEAALQRSQVKHLSPTLEWSMLLYLGWYLTPRVYKAFCFTCCSHQFFRNHVAVTIVILTRRRSFTFILFTVIRSGIFAGFENSILSRWDTRWS